MQEVIIAILFLGAVFFIGRMIWKQYKAEDGCAAGCHSCDISESTKKTDSLPVIKKAQS